MQLAGLVEPKPNVYKICYCWSFGRVPYWLRISEQQLSNAIIGSENPYAEPFAEQFYSFVFTSPIILGPVNYTCIVLKFVFNVE